MKVDHDDVVLAADRWLESKGVVLYAHKTIDRVDDRWDAAQWLAPEVEGVLAELAKIVARRAK